MESPERIFHYFPDLTDQQQEQFTRMGEVYAFWNARINVVSRKDIDVLYTNHVLHSLGIAKVSRIITGHKVLDIGTGGGFPGIPLAILHPDTHFHLVDSINKKIKVVSEVVKALGLSNVTYEATRAENLKNRYHIVVSRAVTRMNRFLPWTKKLYLPESLEGGSKNGLLYLKGGDISEELEETGHSYNLYELSDQFTEPFFETKKVVYLQN